MGANEGKERLMRFLDRREEQPAQPSAAPAGAAASGADSPLRQAVIGALRSVYDPEIPVNIYDLGLIYTLDVDPQAGAVRIDMTLTAPGCPVAGTFPQMVENAVRQVPGVDDVHVELVWDPPWTQDRMTEAVRLQLGLL